MAMNPQNGEILAMVPLPSYDNNAFAQGISSADYKKLLKDPARPMLNQAIADQSPPGSTYKIVTALAGLAEGVITEHTTFYCPGHYYFGNRLYRCWKHSGHGTVEIRRALTESCDVFFYQVGQRLTIPPPRATPEP